MNVYRICSKKKVEEILLNCNLDKIGNYFTNSDKNYYNYVAKKRYMHFFSEKENILYLCSMNENYLCIYDIPEEILNRFRGNGYYLDFVNYRNLIQVTEFAIPSELVSFDYLLSIDKIDYNIEIEDFLDDYNLTSNCENIYHKEHKKLSLKK